MLPLALMMSHLASAQSYKALSEIELKISEAQRLPETQKCWNLSSVSAFDAQDYKVKSDLQVFENGHKYIFTGTDNQVWLSQYTDGAYVSSPLPTAHQVTGMTRASLDGSVIYFVSDKCIECY